MPGEAATGLESIARDELFRSAPAFAQAFESPLRERFGDALASVIFYGSCLRKNSADGVLDFYAVVDEYANAYHSRMLAFANAALAPNVFYLETAEGPATLRAKVAVVSRHDFTNALSGNWLRPGYWARFCQPARVLYARSSSEREHMTHAVVAAMRTAIAVGLSQFEAGDEFHPETFWQRLFRATYACELRPESFETIATLYRANPDRYNAVLAAGIETVQADLDRLGDHYRLNTMPDVRTLPRRRAKLTSTIALVKSAFTFDNWLPYALWKLERHTGTRIEPTERQRRHPFLFGWPLLLRVLTRRQLR